MKEYPIITALGLKLDEGVSFGVHADELEERLKTSRREPTEIGYRDSQEVFVLATEPKLEPITKDEVLALFDDFYKDKTEYTEPDIRKLKERLLAKGLKSE